MLNFGYISQSRRYALKKNMITPKNVNTPVDGQWKLVEINLRCNALRIRVCGEMNYEIKILKIHSLDIAKHMHDTFVISHSYWRTIFKGHRTNSSAKMPNVTNVNMNEIVKQA